MPQVLDSDTEDDILAGRLKSCDLVDFYVKDADGDPAFLRCWNWPGSRDYVANDPEEISGAVGGTDVTYETMFRRIAVNKKLRLSASLSSEPLIITLDASRSGDDEDWVGRFIDSNWHQCRMRVRSVAMHPTTGALRSLPHWEWHGLLDHRNLTRQGGKPQTWEVKCQGGLFRVRGRRMRLRTHEDQQRRADGDRFYNATPLMVGVPMNWAKKPSDIPGVLSTGGVNGFNPQPGGKPGNNRYNRDYDQ